MPCQHINPDDASSQRTIEVPEMLLVAVVEPIQELMTYSPGAKISTTEP